jgi:hypothetical protein
MTSEVSRYDIERLRREHEALEREVRRLSDELRAADARNFERTIGLEPRVNEWSMILFGLSIAFTLLVGFYLKNHHPAGSASAVEAPASAHTNTGLTS